MKPSKMLKQIQCGLCAWALTLCLPSASHAANNDTLPPVNRGLTIVEPPATSKSLKVAIYDGPGSGGKGIDNVAARARQISGTTVTTLTPEQIRTDDLSNYDVIVFSGGSGSKQAKAIGETGRENVRKFIKQGGGYLGICAGAYLACANFDWGLDILNAKTERKWKRGKAFVMIQIDKDGEAILGGTEEPFFIRYANGPILSPLNDPDLPPYHVAASFITEVSENNSKPKVMINAPAAAYSNYGKGRVFVLSPHSENTQGLENMVPRALLWAAGVTD